MLRTVWTEGGYHDVAVLRQTVRERVSVRRSVGLVGKEVKDGPVVPQSIAPTGHPFGHIVDDPINRVLKTAQAFPRDGDRTFRDVEDTGVRIASVDECVDQT